MKAWNPFEIFKFTFGPDGMLQSCMVPKKVGVCPICDGRLYIECNGWYEEDGLYFPDEISLECENEGDETICPSDAQANRMPYVYWLPIQTDCESWLTSMMQIYYGLKPVPQKWLEKNGQLKFEFQSKTEEVKQ